MKKKQADKQKKHINGYPVIKKQLKDFLMDEEGKITKKDIAKLGVSLAVLGMMMQPSLANAQYTNTITGHNSSIDPTGHSSSATHTNSHANHSNHGNHSAGGWMC